MDSEHVLPPPSWSDGPAGPEPRANASECASEALQTVVQPRDVSSEGDVPQSSIEEVENGAPNGQETVECDDDMRISETNATAESQGIVRVRFNGSEWHAPPGVGFDATRASQSEAQPLQEAPLHSYAEETIESNAAQNQESLEAKLPATTPRNLTGRRMNLYSFSVQPTTPTGDTVMSRESACGTTFGLHPLILGYKDTVAHMHHFHVSITLSLLSLRVLCS